MPGPPPPIVDLTFAHHWEAKILASRPLILPKHHFVYPREVEEVERGALEVLVRPALLALKASSLTQEPVPEHPLSANDFLATCALGFRDPSVPTGVWACPNPEEICAVAGGYAYIIDTSAPDRFTMISYRPVFAIQPIRAEGLLLFAGNRSILGWSAKGQAWESEKLSDEGMTITKIEDGTLHGIGWEMTADRETPFAIDLADGQRVRV